jgi:hypothetical protein
MKKVEDSLANFLFRGSNNNYIGFLPSLDLNNKHDYPRNSVSRWQAGYHMTPFENLLLFLSYQNFTQPKCYEFGLQLSAKVERPEITLHTYTACLKHFF